MKSTLHPLFPTAPVKPTYTVTDVARILGVSRKSIYRAIDSSQLEAICLNNSPMRIPMPSLVAFIESSRVDPHA